MEGVLGGCVLYYKTNDKGVAMNEQDEGDRELGGLCQWVRSPLPSCCVAYICSKRCTRPETASFQAPSVSER